MSRARQWAVGVIISAAVIVGIVVYENRGDELCPPEIHQLHAFCDAHHLHYRALKEQDGDKPAYWSILIWPHGKHWWNDETWYDAGVSKPYWKVERPTVQVAVEDVIALVGTKPDGFYVAVHHQLEKCER